MNKLKNILEKFSKVTNSQRDKGSLFEELMYLFLKNDLTYKSRFSKIWKWRDFPHANGMDTGIDLVAQEADTEQYCAIQCKFYADDKRISKDDIDSFISASSKGLYSTRMIISTTDIWGKNAEEAIADLDKPVQRIGKIDLLNSSIDWDLCDFLSQKDPLKIKDKMSLRAHQMEALKQVKAGLEKADRGKLIMACGSGKTFTALKIMENITQQGDNILFLVPSLSLLDQSLKAWIEQTEDSIIPFVVCSDNKVGKGDNNTNAKARNNNEDDSDISVVDLAYPATTSASDLVKHIKIKKQKHGLSKVVIFSTYQSLEVIKKAQQEYDLEEFSLVICDEAHRTTGAGSKSNDKDPLFTLIHSNENIKAKKRLYMTATPRVYTDNAKQTANNKNIEVYSMDDEHLYGNELYRLSFGDAVEKGLLTDYKVLVFAVSKEHVSEAMQIAMAEDGKLDLSDEARVIGCYQSIIKEIDKNTAKTVTENEIATENPMQRLIAFMPKISDSKAYASKFIDSEDTKNTTYKNHFVKTIETYKQGISRSEVDNAKAVNCTMHHIDGTMNALEKKSRINWLAEDVKEGECKILGNVKCLSEGLDVPALDGILFIGTKRSQIDIIQSVGRVMRRAPNKKYGYIIIPIVVSAQEEPDNVLNTDAQYSNIWAIVQALRSHDERLDATINQIQLNEEKPDKIQVMGKISTGFYDKDKINTHTQVIEEVKKHVQQQDTFQLSKLEGGIFTKLVEKCGNRQYWAQWAKDIGDIAKYHITQINNIIQIHEDAKQEFKDFLSNLHSNINNSVSEDEAIEMLAQHIITQPIFDALFQSNEFTKHNPVSMDLQKVVDVFNKYSIDKETQKLETFYNSMKRRIEGLDNAKAKQEVIIDLYDNFFKSAFPKMAERLGIVYTPIEVVDFIIASVEKVLNQEFKRSMNDHNVNILDPFTGTGTFINRLLASEIIKTSQLAHKYKNEIHANEIVLLAYYIASINIENIYHDKIQEDVKNKDIFTAFEGIVLTDTFNLDENSDGKSKSDDTQKTYADVSNDFFVLPENSKRIARQKKTKIQVIIGNPPYSIGQKSENDGNQNLKYPILDKSIEDTYVKYSCANNTKGMYDSYVKAIRWASNKLKNEDYGVIGFVTNGSFIDSIGADGLRKSLGKEFNKIYIFNLRGNQRTSGELSRKEGGKIFGGGSRTPVAITILVKNQQKNTVNQQAEIYYHDIGDYLSRHEKLQKIKNYHDISKITWNNIIPNEKADWINQRNNTIYEDSKDFIQLGNKNKIRQEITIFNNYSIGIVSSRDAWVYNFNYNELANNMQKMCNFYNAQRQEIHALFANENFRNHKLEVTAIVKQLNNDPTEISWSSDLKEAIAKDIAKTFSKKHIRKSMYRPFTQQYLYYGNDFNKGIYQIPKIFPTPSAKNLIIGVTGKGAKEFSCFITNLTPEYSVVGTGQWFPLYLYEAKNSSLLDVRERTKNLLSMLENPHEDVDHTSIANDIKDEDLIRKDAIGDDILLYLNKKYNNSNISKEDIFYYVYGILNNPTYTNEYQDYITREIAKIPFVDSFTQFLSFAQAGRELANIHLNYEDIAPYPHLAINITNPNNVDDKTLYMVDKIKLNKDKTSLVFNPYIKISNIPSEAFAYKVNGKSPLEWIIDRYQVKTHKDSLITNNPNEYDENNPQYIFNLLLKTINVAVKTKEIIDNLPEIIVTK